MAEKKFFLSYQWAYGAEHRLEETHDLQRVLEVVKDAREKEYTGYGGLVVIWGERLEFEPAKVVETYRIKET